MLASSDRGERALIEQIGRGNSSPVYRCGYVSEGQHTSVVAKLTTVQESSVHTLIVKELPNVSPRIFGTVPALPSNLWLIMEDVCPLDSNRCSIGALEIRQAVEMIATVHSQFVDRESELKQLGIQRTSVAPVIPLDKVPDLLDICSTLFEVKFDSGTLGTVQAASSYPEEWIWTPPVSHGTLVHGDLHQQNLVCRIDGNVCIIDWGSASWHVPHWDLILMTEDDLTAYLEVATRTPKLARILGDFSTILRRVKVGRFFQFIATAVKTIFTAPNAQQANVFLKTLPFYVTELAKAAESTPNRLRF